MPIDAPTPNNSPEPDAITGRFDQLPIHEKTWNQCLKLIEGRVNSQSYNTWFKPIIPLRMTETNFVIQVPSQFFSDWLDEHHYSLLNEALTRVTGLEIEVDYEIVAEERDLRPVVPPAPQVSPGPQYPVSAGSPGDEVRKAPPVPFLNPRYTFQNYIKGESNQFACAAALAVANTLGGTSFNPLVIYGGVGLGKTHLVHAIGNHVMQTDRNKRVLYVSSEKFTIDFVEAIQKDRIAEFSNYYRRVDLLIVDDIQFFAGKEKTQDTFFHTFNEIHQLGKQIVLSCDKPPKELKGLNERLISRFQCGLTADVQPPDLETRIAILRKKSGDQGVDLPLPVVEFIALNVTSNIRELEGCLIGLIARSSLEKRPVDLELAKEVIRSIIGEVRTHITVEEIQRVVCGHLGIAEDLIRAKTRKQEVVNARQIAMYLTKELTNSSLKTIGTHFGGRDHSTVIHAYQTVEDGMTKDPKQKNLVQQLRAKLELSLG
jgi:chromosomal replication initiator protein